MKCIYIYVHRERERERERERPAFTKNGTQKIMVLVVCGTSLTLQVWGDSAYGGDCSAVREKLRDVLPAASMWGVP